MIKVKTIKKGIKVGTDIPFQQSYGNVGRWAEEQLANNGYVMSNGKGVDIPGLGVECKTRKVESNSPHTVGTMTIADIINTKYEDSVIFEKFQQQYRVSYSDEGQIVLSENVFDFSDPYIQQQIREAYECGRAEIAAETANDGFPPRYVRGGDFGQFEITESNNSYRFRIPNGAMKKIETISKGASVFNSLFETIDTEA
jgi:hypothetical protein